MVVWVVLKGLAGGVELSGIELSGIELSGIELSGIELRGIGSTGSPCSALAWTRKDPS